MEVADVAKQDCRKDEIGLPRVNLKPGGSKEWYDPAYTETYKTASFMLSSLGRRIRSVRHRVVKNCPHHHGAGTIRTRSGCVFRSSCPRVCAGYTRGGVSQLP